MSLSNGGHFVCIPSSKVLTTSLKVNHAAYLEKHKCGPQKCWLVSFIVSHCLNMDLEILISLMLAVQVRGIQVLST